MNHRLFKYFWLITALSALLARNALSASSARNPSATATLKVEEAQRAFQERSQMIFGQTVSWPMNALGDSAPDFPPDGFYEVDLSNTVLAAALVADLAEKFQDSRLLWMFTTLTNGDIEGITGDMFVVTSGQGYTSIPLLGDKMPMPQPGDVNSVNYPAEFKILTQGICAAKYVVLVPNGPSPGTPSQVGSGGQGTSVETRTGDAGNSVNAVQYYTPTNSANCCDCTPTNPPPSGTYDMTFPCPVSDGTLSVGVGNWVWPLTNGSFWTNYEAVGSSGWTVDGLPPDQTNNVVQQEYPSACPPTWAFSNTNFPQVIVNGSTASVPWTLTPTTCSYTDDSGNTHQCFNGWYYIALSWNLDFACEMTVQHAQDQWEQSDWEESSGVSIASKVDKESGDESACDCELESDRGSIYADLSAFNGTARCYLQLEDRSANVIIPGVVRSKNASSLQPSDALDDDANNTPPVPADFTWHFFELADPGNPWVSSLMSDFMPMMPDNFYDPGSWEQWGWQVDCQVIIVTPDFQNNIEDCQPCDVCDNDSCAPGTTSASLTSDGDMNVSIGLGLDTYGKSAGTLKLTASIPDPSLGTPSSLRYQTSAASEVLRGTNGALRQVLNSQGLVDIVAMNNTSYEISFYTTANSGAQDSSGFYSPSGNPFKTITIANPDTSGATLNELVVTESGVGVANVSDFTWSNAQQQWALTTGNGLRQESCTSSWDPNHINLTAVHTILGSDGVTTVRNEQQIFQLFPWGEELVQKVVDPNGAALTTTWSYYDNQSTDGSNYSHLKQVVEPSGRWETYQYDSVGRIVEVDSQYLDAPLGAPDDQCHVTTTSYGTSDPAVTVVETILGQEVGRRYTVYRPGETLDIHAVAPNAAWNDPGNLVTITSTYVGGLFEGKPQSITRPDGTMSLYQYEYVASGGTSNLVTTTSTGQPNDDASDILNGTRTVTTVNQAGVTVREETHDVTEGIDTLLSWDEAVTFDDFGRATQVDYSDGTTATTVYGCCGVLSTTDREGIATAYTYDSLNRMVTSTRAGITTSNSYDAAGDILSTVRIGSDNSAITLNTSTYDAAGRLISSADAVSNITTWSEMIDGNGHTVKTTTYGDQSTRIETYYQDGQLLSVTGTAVHGVRYVYGADSNGQFTQAIKLTADGNDSSEWTKTYTDMAGRPSMTVSADGSSNRSSYNGQGQLVEQVDPDGVTTLYAYNAKGELETTAIDMDQNSQIDFGGTDRITQTENSVVAADGTTVRRTTTSVWTTNNVDAGSVISVNDVSADGLQSWSISYGLTNHTQTAYGGNGQRTVTTTRPDGSYTVSQYQNGQLVSETQYGSDNVQVASTTCGYDPHGRLATQTDARTGATTFAYDNDDRTISMSAGGQTTSYAYDAFGRQTLITLPDNGTVSSAYYSTGELATNWGARTYPVAYTYDYSGRMQTMTTWQDYAGNNGSATTIWNYDPLRGFLLSKTYADSSSVSYGNSPAGRLLTRTWARGITTTYAYNNAGDLGTITYTDATTPNVTFGFDRQGRKISVTDGAGTHALTYNDAGQLLTETFPNSGVVVTNSYDGLLRRSSLGGIGVSPVQYGYDNASRLQTVTAGSNTATYAYVPNSSLVSNILFQTGGQTKMTTSKSYDNLNRLTSITSVPSAASAVSYSYAYNAANQRTQSTLADGSYWMYTYDALGQVTGGQKYWSDGSAVVGEQFGYTFDTIGNRQTAVVNGNTGTYTANSLNQYSQRTVPGYVWELGTAAPNATVTVNLQPTTREGQYFSEELSVNNTSSAVFTQLTTVAVLRHGAANGDDIVSTATGHEFVPRSPEMFGYDVDGNLTNDGRWAYLWDGENRLISMVAQASLPAAVPREKLLFGYDYQGRRISKVVSNYSGSAWTAVSNLKFVYDGWNLIAESNSTNGLVRSYTWGLDLSGSEQGAGGIGGLLLVSNQGSTATNSFVSYDGNGNVTALVDANSGRVSAQYEYGPFGETLRATGTAAANLFQSSTKYTDPETRLLYYGYRYYDASTGRWLNRDSAETLGVRNAYAFVNNDDSDTIDVLGQYAFNPPISNDGGVTGHTANQSTKAGPDVTAPLKATLDDIQTTYSGKEQDVRECACNAMLAFNIDAYSAWDINQLYLVGSGNVGTIFHQPGTPPWGTTVQLNTGLGNKVYYAGAVNYTMWGYMNKLCAKDFGASQFSLSGAKSRVVLAKLPYLFAQLGQAEAFTSYGYNWSDPSGVALPTGVPPLWGAADPQNLSGWPIFDWFWRGIQNTFTHGQN